MPGRKAKDTEERRFKGVQIRLTPTEYATLNKLADAEGRSMSREIRHLILARFKVLGIE